MFLQIKLLHHQATYTFTISIKRLNAFYTVNPSAAVFTVVPGYECPQRTTRQVQVNVQHPSPSPSPSNTEEPSPSPEPSSLIDNDLPPLLFDLFQSENINWSIEETKNACGEAFNSITLTQQQADNLAARTVQQSKSQLWFNLRIGRITSSNMHSVLRYTGRSYPKSIVNNVMQYKKLNPDLPALIWGRDNEMVTREQYETMQKSKHSISCQLIRTYDQPFVSIHCYKS